MLPMSISSTSGWDRKAWELSRQTVPCSACGEIDRSPSGNCRPCAAARQSSYRKADPDATRKQDEKYAVKRKYGIHASDKERMYESQSGNCAFCHTALPEVWSRGCNIDHDHETLKIRGLVHARCNHVIGVLDKLKSDPLFLANSESYYL